MNARLPAYGFLLVALPLCIHAQNPAAYSIEGRVSDKKSGAPIAYASIYNPSTGKGAISNTDGYFKLMVQGFADSVFVSFIGYERAALLLNNGTRFFDVQLEESAQLLGEVTVVAGDDGWMYDLLHACKTNAPKAKTIAKTYYELKSAVDGEQVELVECFYNSRLEGYDLGDLDLKTGRIALQPRGDRFFVSLESSRAIAMMRVFEENEYFPKSPLEMSRRELKKFWYFDLSKTYRDENRDSMLVLDFVPKNAPGLFFKGQVWVNYSKKQLVKITLECLNATRHPFLPLFDTDTIRKVDLRLTKTFEAINGQAFFKHIDFAYQVSYKSRNKKSYEVTTSAVLYAYDAGKSFLLPRFSFANDRLGDYKKINAIPYNAFFWKNNQELKLNDQKQANEAFFNHPKSLTNKAFFLPNSYIKNGLLEHPYLFWNAQRIRFREFAPPQSSGGVSSAQPFLDKPYNLNIKVFFDLNPFGDTLQHVTATLIDPYGSYYRLPVTDTVLCLINLYFDLVEIERRKLETAIRTSDKSAESFGKLYEKTLAGIEQLKQQYFKEIDRGENKKEMQKWNSCVREKLGIDNIEFFRLYEQADD